MEKCRVNLGSGCNMELTKKEIGDREFKGISEVYLKDYLKTSNINFGESIDIFMMENNFVKVLDDDNKYFFVRQIPRGANKIFKTVESGLLKYNGKTCNVVAPVNLNEYDITSTGNMYQIKFEDGFEAHAFEDELI